MLLKPLYIITHFYLISLSPDWPYRSTLTIPYAACSQTHILRPTSQTPKTHQTVTQYYATQATLHYYALLPHLTISRLTTSVNIDHTICSIQSDAYSPTDLLTHENPSNHHSERCSSSHSTTLRTSTSSHYLPTDHVGQHWPYHMLVACCQTHIPRPTF